LQHFASPSFADKHFCTTVTNKTVEKLFLQRLDVTSIGTEPTAFFFTTTTFDPGVVSPVIAGVSTLRARAAFCTGALDVLIIMPSYLLNVSNMIAV
jgi:hypothetical protein